MGNADYKKPVVATASKRDSQTTYCCFSSDFDVLAFAGGMMTSTLSLSVIQMQS